MIGLISDIHGNFTALEAVLNRLDELNIKEIYCLGDVLGYYPLINECCRELRDRNIETIMGNHDWYVTANVKCPRSKTASQCAAYQSSIITEENKEWMSKRPLFLEKDELSMVHGGWENPLDQYLKPIDNDLLLIPTRCGVSGHTHRALVKEFNGKVYCNPGSVGQPRDYDSRASFAIYNGSSFSIERVSYSVEQFINLCSAHDLPSYIYPRLLKGLPSF